MGLLDADKILTTAEMSSGGNRGQETRNKTLLSTDKLVNKLIVIIPLGLILISNFLTPGAFKSGSILCTKEKFYQTAANATECTVGSHTGKYSKKSGLLEMDWKKKKVEVEAKILTETTTSLNERTTRSNKEEEVIEPEIETQYEYIDDKRTEECKSNQNLYTYQVGGAIKDARGWPQNNARQFYNNYCWENEHLQHFKYEDHWVNISLYHKNNVRKSNGLWHTYKESTQNDSLLLQKYWLYFIVLMTIITCVPQIYWTTTADDIIQPELKFYRQSLIKLVKALIKCSTSGMDTDEFFKFGRGSSTKKVVTEAQKSVEQSSARDSRDEGLVGE